ncbi:MAG: PLP-dependent aminotransferase family protein [Bacteroidales bacterium]|nr:PLP-dependent aminotransferase family protein [Bacteroidales bacterium]
MVKDLNSVLSLSARNMKRSAIRDLLHITSRPGMISFAGGFPDPNTFPVEQLKSIMQDVLNEESVSALQYGTTEGNVRLREALAQRYQKEGLQVTKDNFLITTSSQQAIDLVSKVFLDPGDTLVCGLPSYLGALQSFSAYQACPIGIPKDEELNTVVRALIASGKKPKFIYAIPDFQNPSGVTMTKEQRLEVIDVAKKYDLLIIEDSPYRELRFEGEAEPMMYALDDSNRVITLGTFSKIFVPGFRLGWIIAHPDILEKLVVAKQATDLCAPVFDQCVAARFVDSGAMDDNIKLTIENYRKKRENMLAAFRKYMPQGVSWTEPDGGLFLFMTLPPQFDATELFHMAIQESVAFVIGEAFHCDGSGKNTLRINYSYMPEDRAEEGVRRLAAAIRKMMGETA